MFHLANTGLLGTAYSLPPFRLKRFPILAAFCILVVRGSLVNLGHKNTFNEYNMSKELS